MNENTAGFYKYEEPSLLHGPNYVLDSNYKLYKETKDDYIYPVDGWYWFESVEEAQTFFGISKSPVEEVEK